MKSLRHIGVGFAVSFLGSLPLGYLNVAGWKIYIADGFAPLLWFMLGVIAIEIIVIYLTLIFAEKLIKKKKLLRVIEAFSVVFMFALAAIFYFSGLDGKTQSNSSGDLYSNYPMFIIGVGLSSINFLQLPFWTGWNVYLLNKNHIETAGVRKYFYVFGTAIGTFCGMLVFILVLAELGNSVFSGYLMHVVALAFAILGVVQAWKYYRKYHNKQS